MEKKSTERVLSAGRIPIDTDAAYVVIRILCRYRLVPEDAIGKAGIGEVLPCHIVKSFRAVRGAHAVDLNDDKAEFGLRLHRGVRAEGFGDKRILWPGVDIFDHRVFLLRVKIRGPD